MLMATRRSNYKLQRRRSVGGCCCSVLSAQPQPQRAASTEQPPRLSLPRCRLKKRKKKRKKKKVRLLGSTAPGKKREREGGKKKRPCLLHAHHFSQERAQRRLSRVRFSAERHLPTTTAPTRVASPQPSVNSSRCIVMATIMYSVCVHQQGLLDSMAPQGSWTLLRVGRSRSDKGCCCVGGR